MEMHKHYHKKPVGRQTNFNSKASLECLNQFMVPVARLMASILWKFYFNGVLQAM